jgi:hypothetical protein
VSTVMYDSYVLERYDVVKGEGGSLVFRRLQGASPCEGVGASGISA